MNQFGFYEEDGAILAVATHLTIQPEEFAPKFDIMFWPRLPTVVYSTGENWIDLNTGRAEACIACLWQLTKPVPPNDWRLTLLREFWYGSGFTDWIPDPDVFNEVMNETHDTIDLDAYHGVFTILQEGSSKTLSEIGVDTVNTDADADGKPVEPQRFVMMPDEVRLNKSLSRGAKVTFEALLSYAWKKDYCFPSEEKLAKDIGVCDRTVRRHLKELDQADIIGIEHRGRGKTNRYRLLVLPPRTIKRRKFVKS
jgi:hypothetical protein